MFPVSGALNADQINLGPINLQAEVNKHLAGTAYQTFFSETVSAALDDAATPTTPGTAQTDGATRLLQLATVLSKIIGGTGNWVTRAAAITPGTNDLTTVTGLVAGATSTNTASAILRRDGLGGASVGQLFATAPNAGGNAALLRGATNDPTQFIVAVQNNAGTINNLTVDNLGNTVVRGTLTAASATIAGAVTAGQVQATAPVGGVAMQMRGAPGDPTQYILSVQNNAGTLGNFTVDNLGQGSFRGQVTAPTFVGALSGKATTAGGADSVPASGVSGLLSDAGNIPTSIVRTTALAGYAPVAHNHSGAAEAKIGASGVLPGSLTQDRFSSLYVTPAVSTDGTGWQLTARVNPGQPWNGATYLQFGGGLSPALDPTGIGAGSSRLDLLVINATGNLAWVVGTPAVNPTLPGLGGAQVPIWYARVYSGATAITGYTDTGSGAYLYADARAVFLNPTGQGAATSAAPITATYVTDADESAFLPNAKRMGSALAGAVALTQPGGIGGAATGAGLIRSGYRSSADYDTTLANMLRGAASGGIDMNPAAAFAKIGATVQVAAGYGLEINGQWRYNIAAATSNAAAGASGTRYLYADASGAGPTYALVLSATATPTGTQRLVASYWWDSALTTLFDAWADFTPLIYLPSNSIKPLVSSANLTSSFTIAGTSIGYQTAAFFTLNLARQCAVQMSGFLRVTGTPAAQTLVAIQFYDGTTTTGMGAVVTKNIGANLPVDDGYAVPTQTRTFAAGTHQIGISPWIAGGSTTGLTCTGAYFEAVVLG